MVLAFFFMGVFWLWKIEDRELHSDEEMDEIQRLFNEQSVRKFYLEIFEMKRLGFYISLTWTVLKR
jgi:hypothetical protein